MAAKSRVNPNIVPQFAEIQKFTAGYHDKLQDDEVPPGAAVVGSYNFFLDVDGKWTTRGGSKYLGTKSADTGGVTSSAKLVRRDGVELPILFYSTKSAYFDPVALDWRILDTGYTSGLIFGRAMMEKLTDNVNSLIFCNLTDPYYIWKGATGVVSSFTANTIVITGAVTPQNLGFTDPYGKISDGGVIYTYTGITAQTFTGVTPDPTVSGMANGDPLAQSPRAFSGGTGTIGSFTTDTVTLSGIIIPQVLGFDYPSGVLVDSGVAFKYTGISGQQLTGVTPDPTETLGLANGAVGAFDASSVTLAGTVTPVDLKFTSPTGSFVIQATYAYRFYYTGITGQKFTGVTPDPTTALFGVAVGQNISRGMTAGDTVTAPALDTGNVISVLNGRIVMFSKPAGAIYGGGSLLGSILNDPTSFEQSAPRIASEGFGLMMAEGGGAGRALASYEGGLACFKDNAVSKLTVSLDANDTPALQPLLPYDETASGHVGSIGSKSVFTLGQTVLFVTHTSNILSLQRVLDSNYPQPLPFSDRIQNSVNDLTWDKDCCGIGFDYLGYFCGKTADSSVPNTQLVYDQRYDCWWTPFKGQEISSYFVYGGKLHGTLANSPDAIELMTGRTDYATATELGQKIDCKLILGRSNYGKNGTQTEVKFCYVEGWMSKAGTVAVAFAMDESGKQVSGTIVGTGDSYFFDPVVTGMFSDSPFSVNTFGGQFLNSKRMPDGVGHFRVIFYFEETPIWNIQPSFQTSDYFKLISLGFDAKPSTTAPPSELNQPMS